MQCRGFPGWSAWQTVIGASLDAFKQLGIIGRLRVFFSGQLQTEFLHEFAQRFQFFRRRPLVDPVQHGVPMFLQKTCRTDVGRQHAFLDQFVCIVAYHRHDLLDLALVGEDHLRLDRLEVDRAALRARFQQFLEQFMQM